MDATIIDPQQAKTLIEQGAIQIDVRSHQEFANQPSQGINLPLDLLLDNFSQHIPQNKQQIIILYCQSGERSRRAATLLRGLGYQQLHDLQSYKHCLPE